jgi:hypothetical protein
MEFPGEGSVSRHSAQVAQAYDAKHILEHLAAALIDELADCFAGAACDHV